MEQLLIWLKGNASLLLSIGSFLLAVIGITLAVFFYIKSRRIKEPVYTKKSFNIIQDFSTRLSHLAIQYKNEPVNNLTITKLALWNNGKDTINKIDVAEREPLQVCVIDDCRILDAEVIHFTNPANNFNISDIVNGNSFNILFDYLDNNEGGVIRLIHTGKSSKDVKVQGIVKGAGKPTLISIPVIPSPITSIITKPRHAGYFICISMILMTVIGIGIILFSEEKIIGWILALLYGMMIIPAYFLFIKKRIPEDLESIIEEV